MGIVSYDMISSKTKSNQVPKTLGATFDTANFAECTHTPPTMLYKSPYTTNSISIQTTKKELQTWTTFQWHIYHEGDNIQKTMNKGIVFGIDIITQIWPSFAIHEAIAIKKIKYFWKRNASIMTLNV